MATRSVVELAKRGIAVKAGPNRYRLKASRRALLRRSSAAGEGQGRARLRQLSEAVSRRSRRTPSRCENARQRGSLVDAEAVEREWSDILRTVRSGILAIPSRLTHLAPQERAALDGELRRVLTELGAPT